MGRLTLNVLLSFAQFEREVTGERIRDKIAASKQKGMWMGGYAPLGYRGVGRTLEIDEESAPLVRLIFERYVELGCVRRLKLSLDAENLLSPIRRTTSGKAFGGVRFSRGNLYKILANPVYLGQIVHHQKIYPGQHPSLVSEALWEAAQQLIATNRQGHHRRRAAPSRSLLTGIVVDAHGEKLIPSHSQKSSKRYRYYLSAPLVTGEANAAPRSGLRIPALELENLVLRRVSDWLSDAHGLLQTFPDLPAEQVEAVIGTAKRLATEFSNLEDHCTVLRRIVQQVIVGHEGIRIALLPSGVGIRDREPITLDVPTELKRVGWAMRLYVKGSKTESRQDPILIRSIEKAHQWFKDITANQKSIGEIASTEGITNSMVTRTLYRAFLAPDIVKAILAGTQPLGFTSETLKNALPLPLDWDEQRALLGFSR